LFVGSRYLRADAADSDPPFLKHALPKFSTCFAPIVSAL
jgi:hypothetical protein